MFNKSEYDKEYYKKHTTRKFLLFNYNNPLDVQLLAWLDAQDNYNKYIKDLIRIDMEAHEPRQMEF